MNQAIGYASETFWSLGLPNFSLSRRKTILLPEHPTPPMCEQWEVELDAPLPLRGAGEREGSCSGDVSLRFRVALLMPCRATKGRATFHS